jgi:hypothetical protein
MGSLALQSLELEVEQTVVGKLADAELPAEVYGSPTTTTAEEDHTTSLQAECRLGSTSAEHPQKDLEQLSFPSSLPSWCRWHPPVGWHHS